MTSRLMILFAVAMFLGAIHTPANGEWGSLKGQFVYGDKDTKLPKSMQLKPAKDLQICGKQPLFDETLVINEKNRGVANVVMWAFKPGKIHPQYKQTADDIVRIDNKLCRFEPHAITVRTGQTLQVGNEDPVGHNALINFLKNTSVNPIIPAHAKVDFKLTKSEIIPVKVTCSIHPWMMGVVLVQDHPYMAISDENGKFELKNLPAGKLTLKVWHEKAGYIQSVQIDGKEEKWKKGRYQLDVAGGKTEEHTYRLNQAIFAKR